jgi:hypothetical protein
MLSLRLLLNMVKETEKNKGKGMKIKFNECEVAKKKKILKEIGWMTFFSLLFNRVSK